MGNICKQQQESRLEMIGTFNQGLENNLLLYKNDAPHKSYAVRSTTQPKLNEKVSQILKNQLQKQYFQEIQNLQGHQLPTFYIISKQVYYQGEWKKGLPHGKGKIYFENGSYFQGYFDQGEAFSKNGVLIFCNGSYYRGQIQNSTLEGKNGKFYSKTTIYQGQWKANKPHGYGKEVFADGNTYQGYFIDGLKQGQGTFRWNDGRIYQGQFFRGYMHGQGKYYRGTAEFFEGTFFQNQKQGRGKIKTLYGQYQGQFQNGQLSGFGVFKWNGDNQKIYEGYFRKGKMHGEGTIKFSNGPIVKGIWQNGQNIELTQFLSPKQKN